MEFRHFYFFLSQKVLILFQENQTEDYSYQIRTVIMYGRD
jgi:hypothetical protein